MILYLKAKNDSLGQNIIKVLILFL